MFTTPLAREMPRPTTHHIFPACFLSRVAACSWGGARSCTCSEPRREMTRPSRRQAAVERSRDSPQALENQIGLAVCAKRLVAWRPFFPPPQALAVRRVPLGACSLGEPPLPSFGFHNFFMCVRAHSDYHAAAVAYWSNTTLSGDSEASRLGWLRDDEVEPRRCAPAGCRFQWSVPALALPCLALSRKPCRVWAVSFLD
jgi:hypothetical protein